MIFNWEAPLLLREQGEHSCIAEESPDLHLRARRRLLEGCDQFKIKKC